MNSANMSPDRSKSQELAEDKYGAATTLPAWAPPTMSTTTCTASSHRPRDLTRLSDNEVAQALLHRDRDQIIRPQPYKINENHDLEEKSANAKSVIIPKDHQYKKGKPTASHVYDGPDLEVKVAAKQRDNVSAKSRSTTKVKRTQAEQGEEIQPNDESISGTYQDNDRDAEAKFIVQRPRRIGSRPRWALPPDDEDGDDE